MSLLSLPVEEMERLEETWSCLSVMLSLNSDGEHATKNGAIEILDSDDSRLRQDCVAEGGRNSLAWKSFVSNDGVDRTLDKL